MSWSGVQKAAGNTVSNSNRTVTRGAGASAWWSGRTASGFALGRLYWEITYDVVGVAAQPPLLGITTSAGLGAYVATFPGVDNESSGYYYGQLYYANTSTTYAIGPWGEIAAGKTIGIHLDLSERNIRAALVSDSPSNPLWCNVHGYSSGMTVGETVYPAYALWTAGDKITANWGETPFVIEQMPWGTQSFNQTQFWDDTLIGTNDFADLLEPPKPPMQHVRLTNPDGTPTKAYHDFLTKRYEYDRAVRTLLQEG